MSAAIYKRLPLQNKASLKLHPHNQNYCSGYLGLWEPAVNTTEAAANTPISLRHGGTCVCDIVFDHMTNITPIFALSSYIF